MRTCTVVGCERKHAAHGYCQNHYMRSRRTGSPTGTIRPNALVRLMDQVEVTEGCWLWTGASDEHGYGIVWGIERIDRPYRVLYTMLVGPIPTGFHIDHLCRVPLCVNPDHLEAVTPAENIRRAVPYRTATTVCHRGHPLSGPNLILTARSTRRCRTCTNEYQRNRYQPKYGRRGPQKIFLSA